MQMERFGKVAELEDEESSQELEKLYGTLIDNRTQADMSLGLWGRFFILAASGLLVIVTVLIVACFVGPGCWGFEYLHRDEKKRKKNGLQEIQQNSVSCSKSQSGYPWLDNNDYVIYDARPFGFETRVARVNETSGYHSRERAFSLKCAPLLVAPLQPVKISVPKLEIKVFYSALGREDDAGRLEVQIISATFLPCREYIATLDPSVTLEILNNKWSLQKSERIVHAVQTKVVKNSTSPTFDESFVFDAKKIEIKNWSLKFTIVDNDRLTRVTPLFERRVHLKEVKNLASEERISFSLEMQEVTGNAGALFFGISYLPTAQRLNISVLKGVKLKYQSSVQSLGDFYPYVRVVMVNNRGKCVKKKRTCIRHGDDSPIFDHTLVFDLSISNLEQTVFLVLLCSRALCQNNSDDSSLDEDVDASLKETKDKVLGAVVLGRNVRCTRARDHWVTVMQNPRKMISVWHDLK